MDDPLWLEKRLRQGLVENWCLNMSCTTCGCSKMVSLLTGHEITGSDSSQKAIRKMTWHQAERIVDGLRHCYGEDLREAIMWLLYRLWLRWGDEAHEKLFPALSGTFTSEVLDAMTQHYANVTRPRVPNELRQSRRQRDLFDFGE